jgi:hypothetical protein
MDLLIDRSGFRSHRSVNEGRVQPGRHDIVSLDVHRCRHCLCCEANRSLVDPLFLVAAQRMIRRPFQFIGRQLKKIPLQLAIMFSLEAAVHELDSRVEA